MKRTLWALMLVCAAVITGCALFSDGGTPPPPAASARIACVDVRNPGAAGRCPAKTAGLQIISAAHAEQTIEAGTVTRAQLIEVTQSLENLTPSPFDGYVTARFDAGCNGATEWIVLPLQAVTVPPGEQLQLSVAGSCGDMPTGARQLIATAFGPDGATVVDTATVRFTLIE